MRGQLVCPIGLTTIRTRRRPRSRRRSPRRC
jgi:hypothetical protein